MPHAVARFVYVCPRSPGFSAASCRACENERAAACLGKSEETPARSVKVIVGLELPLPPETSPSAAGSVL